MNTGASTRDGLELLLGNSEGLLNSLIENLIQELCGKSVTVRSTRVTRFDQFIHQADAKAFDLLILIPNNLVSEQTGQVTATPIKDGVRAVHALKRLLSTPLLVICLFEHRKHEEELLREAGADGVLEIPFTCDELKMVVAGLLGKPLPVEA